MSLSYYVKHVWYYHLNTLKIIKGRKDIKRIFELQKIWGKKPQSKRKVICYKCGKIGYYSNKCTTKKKLENLQIDEDLKQQLCKLLLNSLDEEEIESSTESELDIIKFDTSSLDSDECKCTDCKCESCYAIWA